MKTAIENNKGRRQNCIVLILMIIAAVISQAQAQSEGTYKGKFSLPAGSSQNAAFYQNSLIIAIDNAGSVTGKLSFKGGSASEPDEYVHFAGTFKGQLQGSSFNATGTTTMLMLDNKQEKTDKVSFSLSGNVSATGSASQINGKLSITNSGEDGGTEFLAFTASLSEGEGLQLTFPLGKSPMVFDKGWKFGASCILNEGTDSEIDLSNDIEWSGTATFSPAKGPLSSPVFESEGTNKIILTVEDTEGNKIEKEFKVEVVKASDYAHTGCYAKCPSDAHGCPACPMPTVGYIRGSVLDVTINGLSAVVIGDNGMHASCCGANTFELNDGDPNVLIHGKQAVKIGAQTEHCGGKGHVVKVIPSLGLVLTANDSAFYIDPWGEHDRVNSYMYKRFDKKYIGTTYITHQKGSLTLSLFPKGILSVGPNSQVKILSDEGGIMKIQVDKGNIYFNGQSKGEGEVVIELKDCGLVLKGTRFSLFVDDLFMKLDLLEGNVDVKFNKSGETVPVHEGESVTSDFTSITQRIAVDTLAVKKHWQQIAETTPGIKAVEIAEEATSGEPAWKKYLTSQNLLAAGSVVFVLAILAGFLSRRKRKFHKIQRNQATAPPPFQPPAYTPQPGPPVPPPAPIATPKFCQICGNPLKPGAKFCGKCGKQYL